MNIDTATLDELTDFLYDCDCPLFTAQALKDMCKESGNTITMYKVQIAEQSVIARSALERMEYLIYQLEQEQQ